VGPDASGYPGVDAEARGLSATERENLSLEYHLDPPLLLTDADHADGAREGQAVVVVDMDDGIEEVTITSGHSTSAPVRYVCVCLLHSIYPI
jgi:hypothetical protein